jgi:hypothetical protein
MHIEKNIKTPSSHKIRAKTPLERDVPMTGECVSKCLLGRKIETLSATRLSRKNSKTKNVE